MTYRVRDGVSIRRDGIKLTSGDIVADGQLPADDIEHFVKSGLLVPVEKTDKTERKK